MMETTLTFPELSVVLSVLAIMVLIVILIFTLTRKNTEAFKDELDREDLAPGPETESAGAVVMYAYHKKSSGKKCSYCDCENQEAAVCCRVCGQAFPTKGA